MVKARTHDGQRHEGVAGTVMEFPAGQELNVAPGSIVVVRDEEWLVTSAERGSDGWLIRVRGLSELVADATAAFYTSLDDVQVLDPAGAQIRADGSSGYRDSRLWLESMLRKTPIPYGQQSLTVSTRMLSDSLGYQRVAVAKALDPANIRPRILLADSVGLGKTIEIGMILSELVRRGRGERILIVTPRHVLEQMQHELWCRFALPFVRLDSAGIQKVRQKLPATRNPFTYYKRAIISIDTLKQEKYGTVLGKHRWDAVVIDESHNLTNVGTQNNELARLLAPNTEALILASATPHNGRNESFAELLRLLDPTVVGPDGSFTQQDVATLLIRRHRHHAEVANEVGGDWAERAEPINILVEPSPEEDAVATELSQVWLHPTTGRSPYSGENATLFPWTLAKAFLSSPPALAESIAQRRRTVLGGADTPTRRAALTADQRTEIAALDTLAALNEAAANTTAGKFDALVRRLKQIGVGAESDMRAVVFAERIKTLEWLTEKLPEKLGLADIQVRIMHGGLSDIEQQEIVDDFKQSTSKVRVLVAGDVASEGVNLHSQCHHLVHYDIPWSLIRIEQRNGRIDRYGQHFPPVMTSLALAPSDPKFSGDIRVLARLIQREYEAHGALGDVASLMGKHNVGEEESAIRKVLQGTSTLDREIRTVEDVVAGDGLDALWAKFDTAPTSSTELPTVPSDSLYPTDLAFLDEALRAAFHDVPQAAPAAGGVEWTVHPHHSIAELVPPRDLRTRLGQLPQNYLQHGRVLERLKLATSFAAGDQQLTAARNGEGVGGSTWPAAHFLGPLHPVLDWAADRALAALGRNQVFLIRGALDDPTVLLMGTLMNRRGQVISRVFSTVTFPNPANPRMAITEPLTDLRFLLEHTGLKPGSPNPGPVPHANRFQPLIPAAVREGRSSMSMVLDRQEALAHDRIAAWSARADRWQTTAEQMELFGAQKSRVGSFGRRIAEEREVAQSLAPTQQLVRPLLVIVPDHLADHADDEEP